VERAPSELNVAVAPTKSSIWVFGTGEHGGRFVFPVARHWNGRRWSQVKLPKAVNNSGMSCAGASSPANVWAFAGGDPSIARIPRKIPALRVRAARLTVAEDFPGTFVTGCNVVGSGDVWVFGGAEDGIGTWHLTGSHWAERNTGKNVLFNASAVTASDIWATGANGLGLTPAPVLEHWNGRSWSPDTSITSVLPKPTKNKRVALDAVNALSANDVWVLVQVIRESDLSSSFIVVHWNGRKWGRVKPGSPGYYLPTAVSDGHGGWWSQPYADNVSTRYLLHRVGGRWFRSRLPIALIDPILGVPYYEIIRVPHSDTMLVAGSPLHSDSEQGVILALGRL
jgi:hypothetical protein